MLEFVEGSFNEIALFVNLTVIISLNQSIGLGWYDCKGSLLVNET